MKKTKRLGYVNLTAKEFKKKIRVRLFLRQDDDDCVNGLDAQNKSAAKFGAKFYKGKVYEILLVEVKK